MMRIGVGLGVVAMVLGVTTSAVADEDASAKAKDADASLNAKGDKTTELDDIDVGTEDLKAKKARQVAQAGTATAAGNTTRKSRQGEDDTAEQEDRGLPARIPWRGTAISWSNDAAAGAIGVGDDFQSAAFQTYTQTFGASLNYFVIDQKRWSLAVQTTPSFTVELTNSAGTTRQREPWMNDLPVNVVYRRTLFADPDSAWATGLVLRARAFMPTNPASYRQGTYLRTQPAVVMWQSFPGIPKDVAPVLNSFVIGAVANWTHRFGDSVTGVNSDLNVQRIGANGTSTVNAGDAALTQNLQLTGARIAENTLGQAVFLFLGQPIGPTLLQISTGFSFSQQFNRPLATVEDCPPTVINGCSGNVGIDPSNPDTRDNFYAYGFFFSGSFFPVPEAGINFGYSSVGQQLAENGQRENVFYQERNATFSLGLALSIDAIYEVLTGPRRSSPFILVAKKKKDNDRERSIPRKGIRNPTGL